MNILITGGAGFIGTNLALSFAKKGNVITILDNFSRKGTKQNAAYVKRQIPHLSIVEGDVRDCLLVTKTIAHHDIVFHLAGQVAVTTSITNPREDFESNVLGTFNVLEAARKSAHKPLIIYSSTNKVYGKIKSTIQQIEKRYADANHPNGITETEQLDFYSPYGCSKGAADQYVHDYARIYGLPTVVFRQSCIYGYHQFGLEDQGWVAHFVIQALRKKPITIYGTGYQVRDILFIDDLLGAYEAVIGKKDHVTGEVFNIGGGIHHTISLLELIDFLNTTLEDKVSVSFKSVRPGDQEYYVSNIEKASSQLNWKPSIGTAEGLQKLISWVRENRDEIEKLLV